MTISAQLVGAAFRVDRARAAFLVLADLRSFAIRVLGAFWRRIYRRDAQSLDTFEIGVLTICVVGTGFTSVILAYLTVALSVVLTADDRLAFFILANLVLAAVPVADALAALFFALHLHHDLGAVGTFAKAINVLRRVRLRN